MLDEANRDGDYRDHVQSYDRSPWRSRAIHDVDVIRDELYAAIRETKHQQAMKRNLPHRCAD